ncbi:hypothetical protein, partial [Halalkalibacterium halodurans]|uniref:hypothetical protein n=1 Tax=Halalkalibacterium halodurans TaxID=86665 RepID=UPI001ABB4105
FHVFCLNPTALSLGGLLIQVTEISITWMRRFFLLPQTFYSYNLGYLPPVMVQSLTNLREREKDGYHEQATSTS